MLDRVLPFVTKDDSRPILRCVFFVAKEGKLTLVSADGYRLATICLDYDEAEGQALIDRDDLKGISSALKRARRARISFEANSSSTPSNVSSSTYAKILWVKMPLNCTDNTAHNKS